MSFTAEYIPYKATRSFSTIVMDYIDRDPRLQLFYRHSPDLSGIRAAMKERKKYPTDRISLVSRLKEQYTGIELSPKLKANLESLGKDDTFTITTAHQPNIFTGHLYFIYKIIHAIKLADELNAGIDSAHFVPVFYMGTEDADLEELGQIMLGNTSYAWKAKQSGAVGRMKIDNAFLELIAQIEGQIIVLPFGNEIMTLVKKAYTLGKSVEQATLELVNELFGAYGLIVLLPDHPSLKKQFIPIVKRELTENFSNKIITETIGQFPSDYKVQTMGRPINLFYLKDNIRERIETDNNGGFIVANTAINFSKQTIIEELNSHPERFSPNVILRPVYQEMILPGIAFIGGGAEIAYWLELKKLFEDIKLPFPVLVLRNSFMLVRREAKNIIDKLKLSLTDLFVSEDELVRKVVEKHSAVKLELQAERMQLKNYYDKVGDIASATDPTLLQHVAALYANADKKILALEKKMMRAEKVKFESQLRQVKKLRMLLFPGGSLQERLDNLLPYYAIWGTDFIQAVYEHSKGLTQEFCIVEEMA